MIFVAGGMFRLCAQRTEPKKGCGIRLTVQSSRVHRPPPKGNPEISGIRFSRRAINVEQVLNLVHLTSGGGGGELRYGSLIGIEFDTVV